MKRSTPLARKPFTRKLPFPSLQRLRDKHNEECARELPKATRMGSYAGTTTGTPIDKPEAARPGKRTPTLAEREWMDWIVGYGCICCRLEGRGWRMAAVHHILRSGRRIGHLFTLPLCDPGHHQQGESLGMVSRHPWKARFEAQFGTELELLERLQKIKAARELEAQ